MDGIAFDVGEERPAEPVIGLHEHRERQPQQTERDFYAPQSQQQASEDQRYILKWPPPQ